MCVCVYEPAVELVKNNIIHKFLVIYWFTTLSNPVIVTTHATHTHHIFIQYYMDHTYISDLIGTILMQP